MVVDQSSHEESSLLVANSYSISTIDTQNETTLKLKDQASLSIDSVKKEKCHPSDLDLVTRKSSALEVELELLEPMWSGAIRQENPDASAEQLQTLIDVKLDEVGTLIPLRNKAEKMFKDDCQMMDRTHENLTQILGQLRAKPVDDPTVRIEDYQARLLIKDWQSTRVPIFETHYQEASRAWYKPHEDPLVHEFSSIMNKFANLIAQLEYERSIRPAIQVQVNENQDLGNSNSSAKTHPSPNTKNSITTVSFEPFEGNMSDPELLVKFAKWKRSWFELVKELESKPNFNRNILFKRLKEAVSGPALALISKHPAHSIRSYKAALDDLIDRYEDPIQVAGYCIRNGTMAKGSKAEHLEAVKQSMSALHNMRKVYEKEKVDMYNFALIASFVSALPLDLQALWSTYKAQKKQEYELMRESALNVGNTLPAWNAGMVENYETFNVWINLQSKGGAHKRQRTSSGTPLYQESRSKNTKCFICGPESNDHHLTRCAQGLAMSRRTWRETCRRTSVCTKCAQPLKPNHKCDVKCRLCHGRRTEVNHHILMCPLSQFRTGPLGDSPEPSDSSRKRSSHDERRPTGGGKWAKSDRAHPQKHRKRSI